MRIISSLPFVMIHEKEHCFLLSHTRMRCWVLHFSLHFLLPNAHCRVKLSSQLNGILWHSDMKAFYSNMPKIPCQALAPPFLKIFSIVLAMPGLGYGSFRPQRKSIFSSPGCIAGFFRRKGFDSPWAICYNLVTSVHFYANYQ